jgi:exoribonuclease R
MILTHRIIKTLRDAGDNPQNYKQVAAKLKITDANSRNVLIKSLHSLALTKKIKEVERGKYKLNFNEKYIEGRLDISAKGNGYIYNRCL